MKLKFKAKQKCILFFEEFNNTSIELDIPSNKEISVFNLIEFGDGICKLFFNKDSYSYFYRDDFDIIN